MKYTAFVLAGSALFFLGYFVRGYQDGNIFSAKEDVAHSAVAAEGEKAGFTPVQQSGNAAESSEKKPCADIPAMQQAGQTAASPLGGAAGAEGELVSKQETETPEQKLAASLREAGMSEEDIKNMTTPATKEPVEQSAQTEDFYEKSDEERREELAASLREAGFPEEDIENMTANPDKNNMSDEEIARNEQMKSDLAASLREAGFPEEDIKNMTN